MRITTFLLLVCVFCSFAENTHSQNARVSISKRNAQLDEVLGEIEKQTDYLFIYSDAEINASRQVTVKKGTHRVADLLREVLSKNNISFGI